MEVLVSSKRLLLKFSANYCKTVIIIVIKIRNPLW
jgi:hypothetical protein